MEQLVKVGKLKQFLHQPNKKDGQTRSKAQRDASIRPHLGTISVILAAPRKIGSQPSKVMSVAWPPTDGSSPDPKRSKVEV